MLVNLLLASQCTLRGLRLVYCDFLQYKHSEEDLQGSQWSVFSAVSFAERLFEDFY